MKKCLDALSITSVFFIKRRYLEDNAFARDPKLNSLPA